LRPEWITEERPAELMIARLRSEPAYRRLVALDVAGREVLDVARDATGRVLLHRVGEPTPETSALVAAVLPAETIEFGAAPLLRIARLSGTSVADSLGYVLAEVDLQALLAPLQRRSTEATLFLLEMRPGGRVWSDEMEPATGHSPADFAALVAASISGTGGGTILPSPAGTPLSWLCVPCPASSRRHSRCCVRR
jgi:hypothetical protein